jgi:hypothetical protein
MAELRIGECSSRWPVMRRAGRSYPGRAFRVPPAPVAVDGSTAAGYSAGSSRKVADSSPGTPPA